MLHGTLRFQGRGLHLDSEVAGAMSWIRETDVAVRNVIRVMSIDEKAMKAVQVNSQAIIFGGSALTRVQEEIIVTTESVINKCLVRVSRQ